MATPVAHRSNDQPPRTMPSSVRMTAVADLSARRHVDDAEDHVCPLEGRQPLRDFEVFQTMLTGSSVRQYCIRSQYGCTDSPSAP
jgi:hypothetical protein